MPSLSAARARNTCAVHMISLLTSGSSGIVALSRSHLVVRYVHRLVRPHDERSDESVGAWFADETAVVESGAAIGPGTHVWHHAHVRSGATVGRECILGKNVYVDAGVVLGDRVKVQNNVSVYAGVTVDDDAFLGPSCVFTNDLFPRASNPSWTLVHTRVERGASIGANATILCGTTIGEWAMVAAGSVVTRDVSAHQLVVGNPAHGRGWVCRSGHVTSRAAEAPEDPDDCATCQGSLS